MIFESKLNIIYPSYVIENFSESKILENFKFVFENLKKDRSTIFNGENIKKIYLSSSMGPSFKLNFKDI